MFNATYLFALALAMIGLCSASAAQQRLKSGRSPAASPIEQRVDALFRREIRSDGPGCAVGVYRNGAVVFAKGYGLASVEDGRPITARTTFNLGSGSKPFTALAALMLEQRGKLSLDDDVRRWVPELPDYGAPMRVRDLLQHTSGIRDFGSLNVLKGQSVSTMDEFLGLVTGQRALNFVPGTRHEYSHSDYFLLALIIERAAGKPFGEYIESEVLRPMGMYGSFVDDARPRKRTERAVGHKVTIDSSGFGNLNNARIRFPDAWFGGGTNLYASVEDLARWDRNFDNQKVGGPAVIARMLSRPTLPNGDRIPYAFGLRLGEYRGLRTVSRAGHDQGMITEIIRFPEQKFAVAALCNAEHQEFWLLTRKVADIYLDAVMSPARPRPPRPRPPAAVPLSPRELAKYAGIYRPPDEPWNLLPIELRNGVLGEVLFDDERDEMHLPMTPAGDGRFFEIGLTGNVGILAFRSPSPGAAALRLDISWNGEPTGSLERIADSDLWRPSSADLAEFAGFWFSQELDSAWQLEPRGEKLFLRRRGQTALSLRPVQRDQFMRGFGSWMDTQLNAQLQFYRNGEGKLTHFTVSTPAGEDSVRGLRFDRIAAR